MKLKEILEARIAEEERAILDSVHEWAVLKRSGPLAGLFNAGEHSLHSIEVGFMDSVALISSLNDWCDSISKDGENPEVDP